VERQCWPKPSRASRIWSPSKCDPPSPISTFLQPICPQVPDRCSWNLHFAHGNFPISANGKPLRCYGSISQTLPPHYYCRISSLPQRIAKLAIPSNEELEAAVPEPLNSSLPKYCRIIRFSNRWMSALADIMHKRCMRGQRQQVPEEKDDWLLQQAN
jgi:hypothetical protein